MKQFGLIGKRLSYSYSKQIFEQQFPESGSFRYDLFELSDLNRLDNLIKTNPDLEGFNVTIPYKQELLPYIDALSPEAQDTGAVNVVKIVRHSSDYSLLGYNTDVIGFLRSLEGVILPESALIFGTGGAAAAVAFALRKSGVNCHFVSRKEGKNLLTYDALTEEIIRQNLLLVNCTPVGTANTSLEGISLWDRMAVKSAVTERHFLYDLVYNPEETLFLQEGRARGAKTQNGLKMLQFQAEEAWKIWGL